MNAFGPLSGRRPEGAIGIKARATRTPRRAGSARHAGATTFQIRTRPTRPSFKDVLIEGPARPLLLDPWPAHNRNCPGRLQKGARDHIPCAPDRRAGCGLRRHRVGLVGDLKTFWPSTKPGRDSSRKVMIVGVSCVSNRGQEAQDDRSDHAAARSAQHATGKLDNRHVEIVCAASARVNVSVFYQFVDTTNRPSPTSVALCGGESRSGSAWLGRSQKDVLPRGGRRFIRGQGYQLAHTGGAAWSLP